MSRKDLLLVTAIGAEVGLLFQPIILNLWATDLNPALTNAFGVPPSQALVHITAFLGFILLAPLALSILWFFNSLLRRGVASRINILYQFGKFAAVGSSNSFVDIGLLNLALLLTGGLSKESPLFAVLAIGTAFIATINSFLWNKFWTFNAGNVPEKTFVELLKFYAVTGTAALINGGVTWAVANALGGQVSDDLGANIAKVGGIFAGLMINFLGYKFFVFKKQEMPQSVV